LKVRKLILVSVIVGLAISTMASPARASSDSPARVAEIIRSQLFEAERQLLAGEPSAESLAQAELAFAGGFGARIARADAAAAQRAEDGFAAMRTATSQVDAAAFAAGRSQTWTAILAGSYRVVAQALQNGQLTTAQTWLLVREFRTASRFARPNANATKALQSLQAGEMDAATALQFLKADFYDTYQARLNEALRDLEQAHDYDFATRRAELAGLALGYFEILAPAYGEQRGSAALNEAQATFDGLLAAAVSGQAMDAALDRAQAALLDFRAAPLSPEEQARRAGQLLRYVDLVAVEYGRGVSNGQVTKQFEIQEAVTFQQAAQAAFDDLHDVLNQADAQATAQAESLIDGLGAYLQAANMGEQVASPAQLRQDADAIAAALKPLMPQEWLQRSTAGDFDVITSMLDQMENAVRQGDYAAAESARLEAYAIMESGPEARLTAIDPELKLSVEALFWNGDSNSTGLGSLIASGAKLQQIRSEHAALDAQLARVQSLLSVESAPAAIVGNATIIVFREGLEAVLILASLMGSLRLQGQRYRRPLWVGTLLALLATVATWTLARGVLVALARYGEKLEAVVSLIAIAVLLLITNWFFHKNYWDNWLAAFHGRKRRLLTGETGIWLGLVSLGFTSVYREGFETVLFLQALVLDGGTATVLLGVATGLLLTVIVGFLTFRMQSRLPHKKMLVATGILIGAVLLVMVGKTAHVLQLLGWFPGHIIQGVHLPYWAGMWFGLYATWEGLVLQAAAAVLVIGSYLLAEGIKKQERSKAHQQAHA
jgi:high-affinity iron transporter